MANLAEKSAVQERIDEGEVRAVRPYRLGQHQCWSALELACAMCEQWDVAVKRMARRADVERWLANDLNDQNLLNAFLDIAEIPGITPESALITFLQTLLPGAIPAAGVNATGLEPETLKKYLQEAARLGEIDRPPGSRRTAVRRSPADAIEAERLFRIGQTYENGEGVTKNCTEAAKWYLTAAEQGSLTAQYKLGDLYCSGRGVAQDYIDAAKWYRMAAEQGHAEAQREIGLMYANGEGVARDYTEAIRWFKMAASQGNAEAHCLLGMHYLYGMGVDEDDDEAYRWFKAAAEQGDAEAQYHLGQMHQEPGYVEQLKVAQESGNDQILGAAITKSYKYLNRKEAFRWFKMAAEQGYARAQYRVSLLYHCGEGIGGQDYTKAFRWCKMAAEQGYAEAQFILGRYYQLGHGVTPDNAHAFRWCKKAAEQGHAEAQCALGVMSLEGLGVQRNKNEALRWLQLAADQGDKNARSELKKMRRKR